MPEQGDAGTRLFSVIDQALADIPRSRLAGTIAITDGEIHDIPATPPGGAPLNVLIPAKGEETDRRLRVIEAPSYGIVGKSVTLRVAVEDLGVTHRGGTANLTIRRDGDPPKVENVPVGVEQADRRCRSPAPARPWWRLSADKLPGEVSTLNNRAVVEINGVRDRSARAADLRRAESRRTHLAPPAEIRSVGGPGALHHPAAAGEGRPHAAERAGADRLSRCASCSSTRSANST